MTDRPLRAVVAFVVILIVLSGAAYVVQQTLYVRPGPMDLTPSANGFVTGPVSAAPVEPPAPTAQAPAPSGVPQVDADWLRRTAAAAGLSETALGAYARAELSAPAGCGIGWTTLAGIGWVESHHGTIGDRVLQADGHSSSRILGPALDGVGKVAAIPATPETTTYHGDPDWDHAVGPMQFIPTTWESWGTDGDGDGVADPNDLDDASLAAADYLCAGGRDLTTGEGWTGAILSYNNAREYVDAVHSAATAYADRTS